MLSKYAKKSNPEKLMFVTVRNAIDDIYDLSGILTVTLSFMFCPKRKDDPDELDKLLGLSPELFKSLSKYFGWKDKI